MFTMFQRDGHPFTNCWFVEETPKEPLQGTEIPCGWGMGANRKTFRDGGIIILYFLVYKTKVDP